MTVVDQLLDALIKPAGPSRLCDASPARQTAVLDLAGRERVLPTLGWRLLEAGLVDPVPEALVAPLRSSGRTPQGLQAAVFAYQVNRERMLDLGDQLHQLTGVLDQHGIQWIPLKGAALLLDEVWPQPLSREMTDLDILIPDRLRIAEAEDLLKGIGYREVTLAEHPLDPVLPDTHQSRALVLEGRSGSVELHRWLMPDEHATHLSTEAVAGRAVHTGGGWRLTPSDMIRHVIAHARISHWSLVTGGAELRSVLDVGFLLGGKNAPTDLVRSTDSALLRRAVHAHLSAVSRHFGRDDLPTTISGRIWWRWCRTVTSNARLAWLTHDLGMAPVFLRRERMEARTGQPLHGWQRVKVSAGLVLRRIQQAWQDRPARH